MTTESRYFIAIIPPEPIYSEVWQLKQYMRDQYNCKAPLRSPPHITLHMPFAWKTKKEAQLIDVLAQTTINRNSFDLTLDGFGAFAPRVIYIHPNESEELMEFQKRIALTAKRELNLFNANRNDRPFRPHLTIAFRDLKKLLFPAAWEEFENREFKALFEVKGFALLKHDEKQWQIHHQFEFQGSL